MSKNVTDTESIERLLDNIESKISSSPSYFINPTKTHSDNNLNYTKENVITDAKLNLLLNTSHAVPEPVGEITNLFRKLLEADSTYHYVDIPYSPYYQHNPSLKYKYGETQKATSHKSESDYGRNISSTLDMIEELSSSIDKHKNVLQLDTMNTDTKLSNSKFSNSMPINQPVSSSYSSLPRIKESIFVKSSQYPTK